MTVDQSWERIHSFVDWRTEPSNIFVQFFEDNYGGISDKSKLTFLDIGCGTGAQVIYLVNRGCRVIAVDCSETAIAKAMKNISEDKKNLVSWHACDVMSLNEHIEKHSIDCIIDVCSLQNLPLFEVYTLFEVARDNWLKLDTGRVFSKTVTEPFDMSLSRSDYIRFSSAEDVHFMFSGYRYAIYKVLEQLQNGKQTHHYVTDAWLPGTTPSHLQLER